VNMKMEFTKIVLAKFLRLCQLSSVESQTWISFRSLIFDTVGFFPSVETFGPTKIPDKSPDLPRDFENFQQKNSFVKCFLVSKRKARQRNPNASLWI
jgi:hypothetical protein